MFKKEKIFSFSIGFLVIVVMINALIIQAAYVYNQDFYWALIFSIPALAFAIYYTRIVSRRGTKVKKTNNNGIKPNRKNNVNPKGKFDSNSLNVLFGNSYCNQPYLSSIICNDTLTSWQNSNAYDKETFFRKGNNFSRRVDEFIGIKTEFENEVIWQIAAGYPGCRDHNFNFNPEQFKLKASGPDVKMIELKLHGPEKSHKVPAERNIYAEAVINTKYPGIVLKPITKHNAFSSAEGLAIFLDSLRRLSGKKPIGVRFCIVDKKEFHEICYAFRKTQVIPDYIVIEDRGDENGLQMSFYETLLFASRALERYVLEKEVKIVAATKINTGLDVLKLIALGVNGIIMQNILLHENDKKINNIPAAVFSNGYYRLRNEILGSTIDLMKSLGYKMCYYLS